jgi:hypothetical protein
MQQSKRSSIGVGGALESPRGLVKGGMADEKNWKRAQAEWHALGGKAG